MIVSFNPRQINAIQADTQYIYSTAIGGAPVANSISARIITIEGYHIVPGADSAANLVIRDVVGNKTDTVAGTSIVSLLKRINAGYKQSTVFWDSAAVLIRTDYSSGGITGSARTYIVPDDNADHVYNSFTIDPENLAATLGATDTYGDIVYLNISLYYNLVFPNGQSPTITIQIGQGKTPSSWTNLGTHNYTGTGSTEGNFCWNGQIITAGINRVPFTVRLFVHSHSGAGDGSIYVVPRESYINTSYNVD